MLAFNVIFISFLSNSNSKYGRGNPKYKPTKKRFSCKKLAEITLKITR